MSETTNAPASTSTSITAPGNDSLTLADEVKKYDTPGLISFLQEQALRLDENDLEIIRKEKIDGSDFLKMTEERLRSYGMPGGPAMRLADFVTKECKEKKRRAFSTYHSLKEVLAKYGIDSNGTEAIPLFSLKPNEIQDDDKHFKHCMDDILFRMENYGTLHPDSLESMRNEYVSTILHTSVHIAGDSTTKKFIMRPEFEIIGEESSGRVDYAIKVWGKDNFSWYFFNNILMSYISYRRLKILFVSPRIRSSVMFSKVTPKI